MNDTLHTSIVTELNVHASRLAELDSLLEDERNAPKLQRLWKSVQPGSVRRAREASGDAPAGSSKRSKVKASHHEDALPLPPPAAVQEQGGELGIGTTGSSTPMKGDRFGGIEGGQTPWSASSTGGSSSFAWEDANNPSGHQSAGEDGEDLSDWEASSKTGDATLSEMEGESEGSFAGGSGAAESDSEFFSDFEAGEWAPGGVQTKDDGDDVDDDDGMEMALSKR